MRNNMSNADRTIRIVLALVMATLYFTGIVPGGIGLVLLVLSAVFVLTSIAKVCPLYLPFGIKTCKTE